MSKLKNMRLVEIPRFRAVSSGARTLGEIFGGEGSFSSWADAHSHLLEKHIFEPLDFLWHEDRDIDRSVWILAVRDEVTEEDTAPYEIVEFPGGMFLVATGDENDSADFPISGMCNMPNPDGAIDKALGIAQQQIFLPLKFREK